MRRGTWDVHIRRIDIVARGEEENLDLAAFTGALGAFTRPFFVPPWEEYDG